MDRINKMIQKNYDRIKSRNKKVNRISKNRATDLSDLQEYLFYVNKYNRNSIKFKNQKGD